MAEGQGRRTIAGALFFSVIAVSVMDRQMMAILGESIRSELHLTDTELGALAGPLFAVFYALSGLPVARIADRTDRVHVLGWTTILAGVFAAISGFARGFWLLAASRAIVAIGDAGGPPSIWSLVSTYYPPERRARVIASIQLGAPAGAVVAFVSGGLLAATLGWRSGFFFIGAAGIVIGALVFWFVPEPRREADSCASADAEAAAAGPLFGAPTFRWGMCGVAFSGMAMFALAMWAPSVLQRVFGWSPDRTGVLFGLATALAGFAGTWAGGLLAERRRANGDEGAEFWAPCLAVGLATPLSALSFCAPTAAAALGVYALCTFFLLAWNAPSIAALQLIAPERSRALAASWHVFAVNMVGLGVGPLAVGVLSQLLRDAWGEQALAFAVSIVVSSAACASTFCFAKAARAMRASATAVARRPILISE